MNRPLVRQAQSGNSGWRRRSQIDPLSPVLLFLHEQIVKTQMNLVNVLGTVKEGAVSALYTMPN